MSGSAAFAAVVATLSVAVASLRWLRVAQREHYLPGTVTVFYWRWVRIDPINGAGFAIAVAGVVAGVVGLIPIWAAAVIAGVFAMLAPRGLGLKGTSAALRWTDRLKRLAGLLAVAWVGLAAIGLFVPGLVVVGVLALPSLVDAALIAVQPIERRLGDRWVRTAAETIKTVSPQVVAITGSYGKTTTKEYVRQLVSHQLLTVASPASFNNRMGLARAVNEHLTPGVAVFVAEMGTYGPGEIADLCRWIQPDIAVITAIGPVHLERFGSLDKTLAAKSEILENASTAVLNIDDPRLARLADNVSDSEVVTASASGATATVSLDPVGDGFRVSVHGREIAMIGPVAFPSNFACAVGVAVALGVSLDGITDLVAAVQLPQHRQSQYRADAGFVIIDDTYNSNPAGAAAALAALADLPVERRVVVSPGMVELGPVQFAANREFAVEAAKVADDVLIVGKTNRSALRQGAEEGAASVMLMRSRADAVDWVKANLGPNDAVLYENDLPDHYP